MLNTETTGGNSALHAAKAAGNDEFYTQYEDIEKEVQCYLEYDENVFRGKTILLPCDDPEWSNFTKYFALNFEEFGLKQLISTCYIEGGQGKIAVIKSQQEADNIKWAYLNGNGDFHSEEVSQYRNQSDIIITNPPFSLFRDFLAWIIETDAKFLMIGNMNAITYKEVFPLIKNNKIWLGATGNGSDMVFGVPEGAIVAQADREKAARMGYVGNYTRLGNSCWYTSLEHGRRHEPIPLMNTADVLKFSRHKELKGKNFYDHFDNYDAIEIPFVDSIPSDYKGNMGVPISFLDKYCPEQFEILDAREYTKIDKLKQKSTYLIKDADGSVNGKAKYARILIRKK